MQDYGLVSIITPALDCEKFISETIKSVLAQTYQNWELLIQNDCSTDNTDRIVRSFAEKDERIKYETNPVNAGAAGSVKKEGTGTSYPARPCFDKIAWYTRKAHS